MQITERLKEIILNETNIDVVRLTRKRNVVEVRSLYFNLIKYFQPKMTLFEMAESVERNHATVIHSLNNYKMYEMYNDELKQLRSLIIKQIELENILQTNDNDSLKLNIKQKNIKISELELEVELIKQKLTTFEKSEYDIINKLKELLDETKETELHDLIKIRLKAMCDMNIKVMKQK